MFACLYLPPPVKPASAAGATLEWQGQKFYFIGEETRREFAEKNKIAVK